MAQNATAPDLCRTRLTVETPDPYMSHLRFGVEACRKCLDYLVIRIHNSNLTELITDADDGEVLANFCFSADLDDDSCIRWRNCCDNASSCCHQQLLASAATPINSSSCPSTWDGLSCISETSKGTMARVLCPDFLADPSLEIWAQKECSSTGEWITKNGNEFTDYAICKTEQEKWDYQLMLLKVICESISVIMLSVSIFLFLYCRKLYRNPRLAAKYRIHAYTFSAMLLHVASWLLDETVFYLAPNAHENFFRPGCEIIPMMTRLFMNFSYSAMSVEAFFLHWQVVHPFNPIVKPFWLMVTGFCVPFIFNCIYIVLRLQLNDPANEHVVRCWISPFYPYEWLLYGLNIACLALNFALLVNLFRAILKMEQETPGFHANRNRRTPIRQAVKRADFRAMIVFAVIFGFPQAFIIISPPYRGMLYKIYQIISNSVQMLQGTFAAFALCFLSTEVRQAWADTALAKFICRKFVSGHKHRHEKIELKKNLHSRHDNLLLAAN